MLQLSHLPIPPRYRPVHQYQYTGNLFTFATGPYTTSDFVTVTITLADALEPNFSGFVALPGFTFSDGVQTISVRNAFHGVATAFFVTDATGNITEWATGAGSLTGFIATDNDPFGVIDIGRILGPPGEIGANEDQPRVWTIHVITAPDAGPTLSLMTLTLMALGLVARRFQRGAA